MTLLIDTLIIVTLVIAFAGQMIALLKLDVKDARYHEESLDRLTRSLRQRQSAHARSSR